MKQTINEFDFKVGVYVIGTKQHDFVDFKFPHDSTIIDPWRYIPDKDGCTIIRIGE